MVDKGGFHTGDEEWQAGEEPEERLACLSCLS